jgi:hypothetical protein
MSTRAILVGGAVCVGLIMAAAFLISYLELVGTHKGRGGARNLAMALVLAISITAVSASLVNDFNWLTAGLGLYAGLVFWVWLDSLATNLQLGRREGSLPPAPRTRGNGPRRGRA